MNFNLTEVQQSWRERGHALGRELAADAASADVIMGAARVGLIDARADLLAAVVAIEALAHESASAAFTLALHSAVTLGVAGDERFGALLRGEIAGAIALSSEDLPVQENGRLSGRATWVAPLTNRGIAVVAAQGGDALCACAVSLDTPGVTIERMLAAGLRGVVCGHVRFAGVPATTLGPTLPYMSRARVLLASAGLGMGRRALDEALHAARAYSRTGAGGEQTVQGLLADAATDLEAARLLTWKAALHADPSLADASMAKLAATDATQRALLRATQVLGGDSFRRGHIVEQLAQDVRALELFAGRTEALRQAVADETLPRA